VKRFALSLLLLGIACTRAEEPAAPERPAVAPPETTNLLNLAAGAVALDRTAEMTYESSVVHALDGTSATYWSSPPDGPNQTLTFALPALTRLTHVGASTAAEPANAPATIEFEVSADGAEWTPLTIMRVTPSHDFQKVAAGAETRFLRVTTSAPPHQAFAVIRSVVAEGRELEPPRPGSIDGCWWIDGMPARFERRGSRFTGVILTPERPLYLDGGFDGRAYLAMWLKAPMWGHAALTVSPDGRHLSILQWHEDVVWDHTGEGHVGQRADCTDAPFEQAAIVDGVLARAGRYSMYGLRFDTQERLTADSGPAVDALMQLLARHASQRFRIVAREFHKGSPERRLASLREALRDRGADVARIEFVDAGSDPAGRAISTELEKRFVGTMELEVSKGR
jgi:hypothetical protein